MPRWLAIIALSIRTYAKVAKCVWLKWLIHHACTVGGAQGNLENLQRISTYIISKTSIFALTFQRLCARRLSCQKGHVQKWRKMSRCSPRLLWSLAWSISSIQSLQIVYWQLFYPTWNLTFFSNFQRLQSQIIPWRPSMHDFIKLQRKERSLCKCQWQKSMFDCIVKLLSK